MDPDTGPIRINLPRMHLLLGSSLYNIVHTDVGDLLNHAFLGRILSLSLSLGHCSLIQTKVVNLACHSRINIPRMHEMLGPSRRNIVLTDNSLISRRLTSHASAVGLEPD